MTLSEYIQTEFGIVPDEVQLEQIREIVRNEIIKSGLQIKPYTGPNPTMNNKNIFK